MILILSMFMLVTVVITIVLIYVIMKMQRGQRLAFESIAQRIGASVFKKAIQGTSDGAKFECLHKQGPKHAPVNFVVRLFTDAFPGYVNIRKKGLFDRFGIRLSLVREFRTGDLSFDRDFFVEAAKTSLASTLLTDQYVRQTIRELFAENIKTLIVTPSKMEANFFEAKMESIDPGRVKRIIHTLTWFHKNLSFARTSFIHSTKKPISTDAFLAIILIPFLIILFLGFSFALYNAVEFQTIEPTKMIAASVQYSLLRFVPVAVAFNVVFFVLIKHRYDAHRLIITSLIVSFLSLASAGIGYFYFSNRYFDKSSEITNITKITDRYIEKGSKGARMYYLCFNHGKKGVICIKTNKRIYEYLQIENDIKVVTKSGYQNFEWVVDISR
ncbi:MAG: hypothetical protein SFH39_16220 [Candidatus Magnetobacterium sp. LHC-1]|nr:hypothetical protein [Nitrospirota bacterium]